MEDLKFLFSFDKRLTRSGFIGTWFALVFGSILGVALISALPESVLGLFLLVFIGAYVWALLAMYVKRMNDMGWNGWYVLGLLVPLVNIFVFGACLLTPSKK